MQDFSKKIMTSINQGGFLPMAVKCPDIIQIID